MYYGADYYPEHWPEERWAEDARLMKDAGFNVVRVGEFAWSRMEPEEGRYEFGWLDRAIEVLAEHGIAVLLGTPTATPPKWLMDAHPDVYPVDRYGRRRGFGTRRHYCANNVSYRAYTKAIVRKLAARYAGNPNVVGWQIDNEFGCHDTARCYCDACRGAFHDWLARKYKSIQALNEAWGTVFWSQTYDRFDQVVLPSHTVTEMWGNAVHNPGLLLDFYRFSSDSVAAYQRLQIEVLQEQCRQPITHNFMGHFPDLDYFDLAKDLDFVSWDNYPTNQWGESEWVGIAMAHDLMRGTKGRSFWVMEEQSGPCGWNAMGAAPKPGQIRLWAYQGIAHGADGMVFFRWRACPFGIEQYWHGILDHDGTPRRRYEEVKALGEELRAVAPALEGTAPSVKVAIIKSYSNVWSHGFQPHVEGFAYDRLLGDYYRAVRSAGAEAAVVSPEGPFDGYSLLILPALGVLSDAEAERIAGFMEGGGTILTTFRSGTRFPDNSMRRTAPPGPLCDTFGVSVDEFDPLAGERTVDVRGSFGVGTASLWCDVLATRDVEVLATYGSEYYAGRPAVTVRRAGGAAYYVGCDLDQAALGRLVATILEEAGVGPALHGLPPGVEAATRSKGSSRLVFLLNHTGEPKRVSLPRTLTSLLDPNGPVTEVDLPPYEVAVLSD